MKEETRLLILRLLRDEIAKFESRIYFTENMEDSNLWRDELTKAKIAFNDFEANTA